MKLLYVDSFHLTPQEVSALTDLGYEVFLVKPGESPLTVCDHPEDIEVGVFRLDYLDKWGHLLPGLRMDQLSMAGLDSIRDELFEKYPNTAFYSGSGCYGVSIAEWSVAKLLELYRQGPKYGRQQREKNWTWDGSLNTLEVWGKTALVLGTGDIGTECAKRLKAFRCNVLGVNTKGTQRPHFSSCHPMEQLPQLLPQADIIMVTLPLTPSTEWVLNADLLKQAKQGAALIVNSRGKLVDERAMCDMLDSGHLMGAALDCFETEPLPADSPLWDQKNLIIQPHCCGVTHQLRDRYVDWFYQNVKRYIAGEQPVGLVVRGRGY